MTTKSTIGAWARQQTRFFDRVEEVMAGIVLTRAIMLSPKDTGALAENGRVERKNGHRTVKFGDESVPYARRRHFENQKNPQTLNYLERAGDSVAKENPKKFVDMSL